MTTVVKAGATVADATEDTSGKVYLDQAVCNGRLTLTTGVPITTADVTAAGTLYFAPYLGSKVGLYNGTDWAVYNFTQRSLSLTLTSGKNYDVFLYDNAGTLTLELSAAWTNDTTRDDALTTQDGIQVKSDATTRRYLGTLRASGTNTTEDSTAKRFVWNNHNRCVRTSVSPAETTDTWNHTLDSWRQARATSTNRFEYVCGLAEDAIDATVTGMAYQAGAVAVFSVGIGIDSTTVNSAQTLGGSSPSGTPQQSAAQYRGVPGIGYHAVNWLERSFTTTGTTVWMGDGGVPGVRQCGVVGTITA